MNHGFGIFDPNGDDIIDRGEFCQSNYVEDEMLSKIDAERLLKRLKNNEQNGHIAQHQQVDIGNDQPC